MNSFQGCRERWDRRRRPGKTLCRTAPSARTTHMHVSAPLGRALRTRSFLQKDLPLIPEFLQNLLLDPSARGSLVDHQRTLALSLSAGTHHLDVLHDKRRRTPFDAQT
jgi:hypothetical protein